VTEYKKSGGKRGKKGGERKRGRKKQPGVAVLLRMFPTISLCFYYDRTDFLEGGRGKKKKKIERGKEKGEKRKGGGRDVVPRTFPTSIYHRATTQGNIRTKL